MTVYKFFLILWDKYSLLVEAAESGVLLESGIRNGKPHKYAAFHVRGWLPKCVLCEILIFILGKEIENEQQI